MKIGIIGVGSLTLELASRAAQAGYEVIINNPRGNNPVREVIEKMESNVQLGSLENAASAEIILFFVPKDDLKTVIKNLPDMTGKIIIQAGSLIFNPQYTDNTPTHKNTTLMLAGAHVVKLFNPIKLEINSSYPQHRNIEKIFFTSDHAHSSHHTKIFLKKLNFLPINLSTESKLKNMRISLKLGSNPVISKTIESVPKFNIIPATDLNLINSIKIYP
ncbi:NAD(P)-binding domain-containing protein [Flavobacterium sp. MC2016-06]|jgi:predicted dinucleotide-binding enzyme|uniref:NAD(P)-binding domain-containing protein n=1 Tax=Flavobacterium sp. MC2016-06 TaxID=2676308 RepID=UPI0012BABA5C|nr:NAD(P)-binding domain-containing protein [Flavobacterium sp. MC2016-06]MBU3860323.1 NAD(P)-binding domain-containing protein [Flavobacterium sp. MC2016-06]